MRNYNSENEVPEKTKVYQVTTKNYCSTVINYSKHEITIIRNIQLWIKFIKLEVTLAISKLFLIFSYVIN